MRGSSLEVSIVAEQLRRAVPGGIGTYARGLVLGLSRLWADPETLEPARVRVIASRSPFGVRDPLGALGLPLDTIGLPGALLTRAWDRGLLAVPRSRPLGGADPATVGGADPATLGGADRTRASRADPAPGARRRVVHSVSTLAPPVRGAALSVTVHDLAWRRLPSAYPARGRRWHEAALERAARRAAVIVVPSEATAADLRAAGIGEERIAVIAEGADHLAPPDDAGADELLARLGISAPAGVGPAAPPTEGSDPAAPGGGGFLLSVGTLEPRKNLGRLLAAYAVARSRLAEPWKLLVVGPAGWGGPIELPEGAVLAGAVSDGVLSALYRRARVFAYVPLYEGFGLPAAEAMASGTAVVASSGVPSADGVGETVDPRDVESIAAALVALSEDGPRRDSAIAAGSERAALLTWQAAAARHVELWERLAGA
ncbi:MAG: glycosyltransferase family 4 protein [Acidimicrobiales bacterium]